MSTEFPSDIIQTATVAIFSPDMKRIIVVTNEKLWIIIPPGGKYEKEKDKDIFATAMREVKEEVWIDISLIIGDFLSRDGNIALSPEIIGVHNFTFSHNWDKGEDFLYFFRLKEEINKKNLVAEKEGMYFFKSEIRQRHVSMNNRIFRVLIQPTKSNILRVMQD